MNETKIQWTDMSWNPIRARHPAGTERVPGHYCEKISPGCALCYASRMQGRFGMPQFPGAGAKAKGQATAEPFLDEKKLTEPLRKRKGGRVFVCDMSDLFGEWVPFEWIDKVFAVMALTPQHTYQILTKRAGRMADYFSEVSTGRTVKWGRYAGQPIPDAPAAQIRLYTAMVQRTGKYHACGPGWPLPNVHLGVSVENQKTADERIPHLLRCPAGVRFLSCEPLLEQVEVKYYLSSHRVTDRRKGGNYCYTERVDWVIVGGESGPGARPCNVEWVRSIVGQCKAAGVPVFVEQLGAKPEGTWLPDDGYANKRFRLGTFALKDSKGGDPSEWPADLRIREFPAETAVPR